MNAFYEHHKNSIQFGYRCFDRLLLNGLIQPFQQPERVLGLSLSFLSFEECCAMAMRHTGPRPRAFV